MKYLRLVRSLLLLFMFSVCSAVDVIPHAILPKYVIPGGKVRVMIGGSCNNLTNFSAGIGSRNIRVEACEPAASPRSNWNWLVLKLEPSPPLKPYPYAEGWQRLWIRANDGVFDSKSPPLALPDRLGRNVQVIPYIDNFLAHSKTTSSLNISNLMRSWISRQLLLSSDSKQAIAEDAATLSSLSFVPLRFPYERENKVINGNWSSGENNNGENVIPKITDLTHRVNLKEAALKLNFNIKNPNARSICNSGVLYQLSRTLELSELSAAGLLIEAVNQTLSNSGDVIGPATLGQPTDTFVSNGFRDPEERTWTSLESTGVFNSRSRQFDIQENPAKIYLIDTLGADGKDRFLTRRVPFNNLNGFYTMVGHGTAIYQLLKDQTFGIAPSSNVKPFLACGSNGCAADKVIQGICEAAQEASKSSKRNVVINLSISTSYDHPLINRAIRDALVAGAAVVTAYGNDDPCDNRQLSQMDYCNAYPADWVGEDSGFYSVGAIEVHSDSKKIEIRDFQRGKERMGNSIIDETLMATKPSALAPGQYWLPAKPSSGSKLYSPNLSIYPGTSFSAPILTGMLALWSQKCATRYNSWPKVSGGKIVDISILNC